MHPKDAGKDGRQKEKRVAEDELVRWHHQLDGHEFEHAPGVGDGQGSLACCGPQGCRVGHNLATRRQNTPIFTEAIFTTAKIWKQSKYPRTDERRESVACLYNGILLWLFSCQAVSSSLRLHGLQHATLTAGGLRGLEGHLKLQDTQTCLLHPS